MGFIALTIPATVFFQPAPSRQSQMPVTIATSVRTSNVFFLQEAWALLPA
jgi:hypothetical protein